MTEQERQQAFVDEYNALVQKYGIAFAAIVQPEQLGAVIQVRPQLTLSPVQDWKAPEDTATKTPKGKE